MQSSLPKHFKTSDNVVVFLSGPSSLSTPLDILHRHDVICANGSIDYLLDNSITPLAYIVTDRNFFHNNLEKYFKNARQAKYNIISEELYHSANHKEKQKLDDVKPLVIGRFSKKKNPGIATRAWLRAKSSRNKDFVCTVPLSRGKRIIGFSKNITSGYFNTRTVAYAAVQLAYSLEYKKIYLSGFDMTGSAGRFYEKETPEDNKMKTTLDDDFGDIMSFFTFMKDNIDINIFNMSKFTRVPASVIPYGTPDTSLAVEQQPEIQRSRVSA